MQIYKKKEKIKNQNNYSLALSIHLNYILSVAYIFFITDTFLCIFKLKNI